MKYTCLIVLEARDVLISLRHPGDVSEQVVEYVATQLDVAAASMATYTEREKTRLEHQWEMRARSVTATSSTLRPSLPSGSMTGRGRRARARWRSSTVQLGWLGEREVLLPGVATLAWLRCASLRPRTLQHLSTARSAQSPRLTAEDGAGARAAHARSRTRPHCAAMT
jgi:hypothetical protein